MIKLGSNSIGKVYLGSNPIGKAYLGSNLVFSRGSGPQPTTNVAYIRGGADGSYIDTGITPNQTTRVIVWARNFNPTGSTNVWLFGSRIAYKNTMFDLVLANNNITGAIEQGFGNNSALIYDAWRFCSHYHKYEMSSSGLYIDDVQIATVTASSFSSLLNLHLFGYNSNGTHTDNSLPIDICACQIYKNGVLVRDYTPVNSSSVVGLYDAVSNTVFTNAGSGSFTYGKFNLNAYTPLEYIECDGNQYFNSGIVGGYSVPIVVKCRPSGTSARYYVVVGGRVYPSKRCEFFFGTTTTANTAITVGYYNTSSNLYQSVSLTGTDVVLVKSNNQFYAYKNNAALGSSYTGNASASFSTGYELYVGTVNDSGSALSNQMFIGRLYAVSLGNFRNFVPAKKNNVAGMYDTYNDVFFPSATSTPFIAGPEL